MTPMMPVVTLVVPAGGGSQMARDESGDKCEDAHLSALSLSPVGDKFVNYLTTTE